MGCGSSKAVVVPKDAVTIKVKEDAGSSTIEAQSPPSYDQCQLEKSDDNTEEDKSSSADLARNQSNLSSKPILGPIPPGASDGESSSAMAITSPQGDKSSEEGVRKPVSFEVAISSNGEAASKKPPRRLQKLESATTLTAKALEEKQRAVEERKQQELDKKTKHLSKKERLRKEIRDAREFEKAQQQYVAIEQRLTSGELKRAKAREEMREKQKKREDHAKKVKARRGSVSDSVGVESISSTLEADSLYNADTTESAWDDVGNDDKKKDVDPTTNKAMVDSHDDFFGGEDKSEGRVDSRPSLEHEVVM